MSTFTLGTAQLGMEYGAVNDAGKPARAHALCIVKRAIEGGVSAIDTARCYGDAEEIVGQTLAHGPRVPVISKLDPLKAIPRTADGATVRSAVEASVLASCQALRTEQLHTLLLHDWRHHSMWGGAAWERLLRFKEDGVIRILGASVYQPSEALAGLRDPAIQHLQIPMNLLDGRWKAARVHHAIAGRPDVAIHARSALLQGILLHSADRWPAVDGLNADACVAHLRKMALEFGRHNIADLCFAYLRSQSWIHSIVVGCETLPQLEQNLALFRTPLLALAQCDEVEGALPVPEDLLHPGKWPSRELASQLN